MTMRYPVNQPDMRLSDAERNAAMSALGRAFSEGRLTVDEYDQRCTEITRAEVRGDLEPLFRDIPQFQGRPGMEVDKLYSAQEIEGAYREGRRVRLGLLGLTSVGSIVGAAALSALTPMSGLLIFVIPTVWILLYIMKIGPESWHVPSPRAVDKQRIRELKTAEQLRAAELRLAEQDKLAELRAERRAQTAELTNKAMGFVNKALERGDK